MSAEVAAERTAGAAPVLQSVLAQVRAELIMTSRRGENLLVTIVFPVFLLIALRSFFNVPLNTLLPGVLTAAVMSSGMVSLGIATGYDRYYGVLKRLGTSPLPRWGLLVAKIATLLVVLLVQVVLLLALAAVFYGWRPTGGFWAVLPILLLGTVAFAGLGMFMAGALRAEATLAAANGLYLFLLLFGGVFAPLPGIAGVISGLLPSAALTVSLSGALRAQAVPPGSILILLVWAALFLVATALTFKWE